MAVFDPIALQRMQAIYRDVVKSLSRVSGLPATQDLERIAQDILHSVAANKSTHEEIVAAICARAVSRSGDRIGDEEKLTR